MDTKKTITCYCLQDKIKAKVRIRKRRRKYIFKKENIADVLLRTAPFQARKFK